MAYKRSATGDAERPLAVDEVAVLPEQLLTPARKKLDGVRLLMTAVLADGIDSFLSSHPGRSGRGRYEEAAAWIFSEDARWPFSFASLCDALEIDAGRLREELLRRKSAEARRPPMPPEARAAGARFRTAA